MVWTGGEQFYLLMWNNWNAPETSMCSPGTTRKLDRWRKWKNCNDTNCLVEKQRCALWSNSTQPLFPATLGVRIDPQGRNTYCNNLCQEMTHRVVCIWSIWVLGHDAATAVHHLWDLAMPRDCWLAEIVNFCKDVHIACSTSTACKHRWSFHWKFDISGFLVNVLHQPEYGSTLTWQKQCCIAGHTCPQSQRSILCSCFSNQVKRVTFSVITVLLFKIRQSTFGEPLTINQDV